MSVSIDLRALSASMVKKAILINEISETDKNIKTKKSPRKTDTDKLSPIKFDLNKISKKTVIVSLNETQDVKSKCRVRYSITADANKKLLNAYNVLLNISLSLEDDQISKAVGIKKSTFDKDVIKPVEKLMMSSIKENKVSLRPNVFVKPRTIKPAFVKIYNRLEESDADVSQIMYDQKNKISSLADASKMMRLYVSHFDLKKGHKTLKFHLDSFLSQTFEEQTLYAIYDKNGDKIISQGQLQTLATMLVGEMIEED